MLTTNKTGVPVGRNLVESGVLAPGAVKAGVIAQSLIHDKLLHPDLAMKALKLAAGRSCPIEVALRSLGWRQERYRFANSLGDLLMKAGVMRPDQWTAAVEVGFASTLPLSRILVMRQTITEVLAFAAVGAQAFMREHKISQDQAVDLVHSASGK